MVRVVPQPGVRELREELSAVGFDVRLLDRHDIWRHVAKQPRDAGNPLAAVGGDQVSVCDVESDESELHSNDLVPSVPKYDPGFARAVGRFKRGPRGGGT